MTFRKRTARGKTLLQREEAVTMELILAAAVPALGCSVIGMLPKWVAVWAVSGHRIQKTIGAVTEA
jgi:hypothetical protein